MATPPRRRSSERRRCRGAPSPSDIIARRAGVIVTSVIGLLALVGAAAQGAAFVDQGHPSASMIMAILTGVALLCYGVSLYLLESPGQ